MTSTMQAFPPVVSPYLPLIIVHIGAGCLAILTGYVAVTVEKGERLHRLFGKIFVVSMLVMAGMATYLAITFLNVLPGQPPNVAAGFLVPYLVGTALVTVRRKEGTVGAFEKVALAVVLALGAVFGFWGIKALLSSDHKFAGYPFYFFFVFAGMAALFAGLDMRVLLKGGLRGAARIARHLWRMCFAFFFATGSFFLGQHKVMPVSMHGAWYLFALGLAPLAFMVFWLISVRIRRRFRAPQASPTEVH